MSAAEIAEYQRRVEAVPGLESEWVALTRDYDTQQTAYKELLTKSRPRQAGGQPRGAEDRRALPHRRSGGGAGAAAAVACASGYNAVGLAIGLLIGLGWRCCSS